MSDFSEWPNWSDWPKPEYNNTAGRLLVVLAEVKKQKQAWPTHVVWRKVLLRDKFDTINNRINDDDWGRVTSALNVLYRAVLDIEEDIREREPEDHHVFLAEFGTLKKIFSPENLTSDFAQQASLIKGELLANLRHCARAMDKEQEIEEDELKSLYDNASALFELVMTTKMPRKLRRLLLSLIDKVRQAVAHFRIFGAKGLDDALTSLVGGLIVHQNEIVAIDNRNIIIKGFDNLWKQLATVAKRIDDVQKITNAVLTIGPIAQDIIDTL